LLFGILLLSGYSFRTAQQDVKVNETARIFQEFTKRAQRYADMHKKVKSQLPPIDANATPVMISRYQKSLASAIQDARADARKGDIFFPEARSEFRRIIVSEFAGPNGKSARALIQNDRLRKLFLRVNAVYPEDVPLAAMPRSLLINLPPLPREVEYRFVKRDLILLDVSARLIVDFITDVVPIS
jgi:hypothetical protein